MDIESRQIDAYRKMTGEQRLRIGLQLFETSVDIARQAIRNQSPDADEATIEKHVQQRIRIGYTLDASGTPCS